MLPAPFLQLDEQAMTEILYGLNVSGEAHQNKGNEEYANRWAWHLTFLTADYDTKKGATGHSIKPVLHNLRTNQIPGLQEQSAENTSKQEHKEGTQTTSQIILATNTVLIIETAKLYLVL